MDTYPKDIEAASDEAPLLSKSGMIWYKNNDTDELNPLNKIRIHDPTLI